MKLYPSTDRRLRWTPGLRAALFLVALGPIWGCGSGTAGGGGGTRPAASVSLADLQGEWQYIRVQDGQAFSGDCITIEEARVTHFIDTCDGADLLEASEDITTNGATGVLQFTVTVAGSGDTDPIVLDITATLTRNGDDFTGTEQRIVPPSAEDEPVENQVVLRRPDAQP
ncbi:MAG: hypothetical protein V2A79_12600 [Planctomycetota bacterium]